MGPSGLGGLTREPNVVPMIDILLVLLIAAILWALPGYKVDVQLPVPAPTPAGPTTEKSIVLSVSPGPKYVVNGTDVAKDDLIPFLTRLYAGRPDKILFIDADRSMTYQDVYWLYGSVRDAGVTVTAIVPKETRRDGAGPARRTASANP